MPEEDAVIKFHINYDRKNLDTMEKRNTLKHSLDTIKLSKL